jgi:hypothetical protein
VSVGSSWGKQVLDERREQGTTTVLKEESMCDYTDGSLVL